MSKLTAVLDLRSKAMDPHPVHYGALPVHPFAGTHKQQIRPAFLYGLLRIGLVSSALDLSRRPICRICRWKYDFVGLVKTNHCGTATAEGKFRASASGDRTETRRRKAIPC